MGYFVQLIIFLVYNNFSYYNFKNLRNNKMSALGYLANRYEGGECYAACM